MPIDNTTKDSQLAPIQESKLRIYVTSKPIARNIGKKVATFSAISALLGVCGATAFGVWLGILLIINPDTGAAWLNRYLPKWTHISIGTTDRVQTLDQIQTEIRHQKLIPGEPLFVNNQAPNADMLLPVLASRPDCQSNCQQIVELRAYQAIGIDSNYRLVNQVVVTGPDEYFVKHSSEIDTQESSHALPLTQMTRIVGKAPGIWLNFKGELTNGETSIAYGQVVHYNPSSYHLNVMVPWSSPAGQDPYWHLLTNSEQPRLVINQTTGLEPKFRLYQLIPRQFAPDPIELEEISLKLPASDDERYLKGLALARSSLWYTAWEWLQVLKKDDLSTNVQTQMDLIEVHALFTQAQSKKAWASPSQQVLAHLINGTWSEAIKVFQASEGENFSEIINLLKNDSGRIWNRIEATLKFDSSQDDVKAWGVLLKAAKEGHPEAIAWLQEQSLNTSGTLKRVEPLLDQMEIAIAEAEIPDTHVSQVIGSAKPLTQINQADWLIADESDQTTSPFQLEDQQVWYQVRVGSFHDGQQWQDAPFTNMKRPLVKSAKVLWRLLGLNTDPHIMITVWKPNGQQESVMATVKAVSITGSGLQLLAGGEAMNAATPKEHLNFLAHTQTALHFLDLHSITLTELSQTQPQWVSAILPTLWRELQNAGIGSLGQGKPPSVSVMLQQLGQLSVQQINNLTSNNHPYAVLTIYQDNSLKTASKKPAPNSSDRFKPHTLIFSDSGALIYNELAKDGKQSMVALANLGDGDAPALIVDGSSSYSIKRWSSGRQRFD